MESRSRSIGQRIWANVLGVLAVVAVGIGLGSRRRILSSGKRYQQLQRDAEREALLARGWSPATPQRLIKPSYAPFFFGLGIAFLLGGIATDFMISGVGLFIFGFGLFGWIRDLLDEQSSG